MMRHGRFRRCPRWTRAGRIRLAVAAASLVVVAGCASVEPLIARQQCWQDCGQALREQDCRNAPARDSVHVDRRWERDYGGDAYCRLEREACMRTCSASADADGGDPLAASDTRYRVRPRDATASRDRRERVRSPVVRCSLLPQCGIAG